MGASRLTQEGVLWPDDPLIQQEELLPLPQGGAVFAPELPWDQAEARR